MPEPKKKSLNCHVEEFLDYYCDLSSPPNYAVLLNGDWGAGKTWFIKNYQERQKKHEFLYVSLYGLTTFSEIEDAFFQQLNPLMASKGMVIAGKILKGFIKGSLKVDLDQDGKDDGSWSFQVPDIPRYLKGLDKRILIFDDLERCKIELSNILGYINFFVEHNDIKVIIVANEEIIISKLDDYKSIKEKLIGKTFSISLDFIEALNTFINDIDPILREFLSNNIELIRSLFEMADYNNLRVLRQIILDFERIYNLISEKAKTSTELLKDLLKLLTIFSVETKRGELSSTDIHKLVSEYELYFSRDVYKEQYSIHKDSSIQKMFARYSDKIQPEYLYDPFPSLLWWENFFFKGMIDDVELNKTAIIQYFQDENTPNWRKLWHANKLTDEEFISLLEKVETDFISILNLDIAVIKHIAGLFLFYSDTELYSKSKEQILIETKAYIDLLNDIDIINPNDLWGNRASLGLAYYGQELPEFIELSNYIYASIDRKTIEVIPEKAIDLLDIMKNDVRTFVIMMHLSNSDQQIYCEVPILKYMDKNSFIHTFLSLNSEEKYHVGYALRKRYEVESINRKLTDEYNWLVDVRDLLKSEADKLNGKLSGYLLGAIIKNDFDLAINQLGKSIGNEIK